MKRGCFFLRPGVPSGGFLGRVRDGAWSRPEEYMSNGTDRSGMLRIDMSKPQQISAGAASYVERSEEELELMAKKAEK